MKANCSTPDSRTCEKVVFLKQNPLISVQTRTNSAVYWTWFTNYSMSNCATCFLCVPHSSPDTVSHQSKSRSRGHGDNVLLPQKSLHIFNQRLLRRHICAVSFHRWTQSKLSQYARFGRHALQMGHGWDLWAWYIWLKKNGKSYAWVLSCNKLQFAAMLMFAPQAPGFTPWC